MFVRFKRLEGCELEIPKYYTNGSAAFDLRSNEKFILKPGERRLVKTGFSLAIDHGYVGLLSPRSGLAIKHGIGIVNSPAIIDSDFRGELGIILINHGQESFSIDVGDRIAQMTIVKHEIAVIEEAEELDVTGRLGGFGSTGKH